jgi:TPR repeat protein
MDAQSSRVFLGGRRRSFPSRAAPIALFALGCGTAPKVEPTVVVDGPAHMTASTDAGAAPPAQAFKVPECPGERPAFQTACDRGSPTGCACLGWALYTGTSGPVDLPAARGKLDHACDASVPVACTYAGIMASNGEGGVKDEARGAALFQKACDAGELPACGEVGRLRWEGTVLELDEVLAATLLDKGCQAGSVGACKLLGLLYLVGEKTPHDPAKAEQLFTRACAASEDGAECQFQAMTLSGSFSCSRGDCVWTPLRSFSGDGASDDRPMLLPKDLPRARTIFGGACKRGQSTSCAFEKELAFSQVGTAEDFAAIKKQAWVKGSSAVGCETKMVREWLRVSCRGKKQTRIAVTRDALGVTKGPFGFSSGGGFSFFTPVVEGADLEATFLVAEKPYVITVAWPRGKGPSARVGEIRPR